MNPKRIRISSDHDAVAAIEAVKADGVPRIVEIDGEEAAAIVSVGDLARSTDAPFDKDRVRRALAAAGSWRGLDEDDLAEKIYRWRHEAPPSEPHTV